MGIVLVIIYVLFVVINKKNAQYIFNGFAIVFAPYCIIIPLNNYYFTDFIRITDGSILIIMSGMILYEFVFYIFYSASSHNGSVMKVYKVFMTYLISINESTIN